MAEGSSPDYWQFICEHRDRVLALIKETDWVEESNQDGIRISYRETDKGRMVQVETQLDVPPAVGRRYVTPGPISNGLREKYVKKNPIKEFKIIQEADKYVIAYEVLHGLMGGVVAERDFVNVYGFEDDSDIGAYLISTSVEHPDYPPLYEPVRATMHISGQMFLRVDGDPNKCMFHGLSLVDLGGMLPVALIQPVQSRMLFKGTGEMKKAIAKKFHEQN